MPFMGKDWRAPGETWVRINHTAGWEQIKLRPIQLSASPETISCLNIDDKLRRPPSSNSLSSNEENTSSSENSVDGVLRSDSDESVSMFEDEESWIPHCFVKTNRSKEFIGCTSMSEAFHRLDLARKVQDIRKFNYISKVVQILVQEKLQNLSATARKHLFAIIQAIVLHSVDEDLHISTARDLVNQFGAGLEGHVCGSPQLVNRQLDAVSDLLELINEKQPKTLPDSSEDSITFLDLPREVISQVLRRLPDHVSLLEAAKALKPLEALVDREAKLWETLCRFHFTQEQIDKQKTPNVTWRHAFFQLKKYYGLREIYAGMIHICCSCRALFWNDIGHPCVSQEAPSVRVTPQQFIDMLLFL